MRIGCPNCDALYEVDETAIPPDGRDVQCSNCGHAWFQPHPEAVAAAAAEEAVFGTDAPVKTAPPPPPLPPPPPPPPPPSPPEPPELPEPPASGDGDPAEDPAAPPAGSEAAPLRRTLDESLLAVLREEAAREADLRKREAPRGVEVQPDLGLPAAALRRAPAAPPGPAADPDPVPAERPQRRDLLPDIEEINSTLRPGAEARGQGAAAEDAPAVRRAGFRSGFVSVVAVFAVLALLYILAPRLSAAVPAASGLIDGYVAAVDGLRLWLDGLMRGASGAIRGISGQDG